METPESGPRFDEVLWSRLFGLPTVSSVIRAWRHASRTAAVPYGILGYTILFVYSLPALTPRWILFFGLYGLGLIFFGVPFMAGWLLWMQDRRRQFDEMNDAMKELEQFYNDHPPIPPALISLRDKAFKLGRSLHARVGRKVGDAAP